MISLLAEAGVTFSQAREEANLPWQREFNRRRANAEQTLHQRNPVGICSDLLGRCGLAVFCRDSP